MLRESDNEEVISDNVIQGIRLSSPNIYNIFFAFYLFMSLGFAHAEIYFHALRRL